MLPTTTLFRVCWDCRHRWDQSYWISCGSNHKLQDSRVGLGDTLKLVCLVVAFLLGSTRQTLISVPVCAALVLLFSRETVKTLAFLSYWIGLYRTGQTIVWIDSCQSWLKRVVKPVFDTHSHPSNHFCLSQIRTKVYLLLFRSLEVPSYERAAAWYRHTSNF